MDWFFDNKNKNVAKNASRVVADMHKHLDIQNKKVLELEHTITKFKSLFTNNLENELDRLEKKKKDLLNELDETEAAILSAQTKLTEAHNEIESIISTSNNEMKSIGTPLYNDKRTQNYSPKASSPRLKILTEDQAQDLEELYLEETELLASIKENQNENYLFIIHRNDTSDIILYLSQDSENNKNKNDNLKFSSVADIVTVKKMADYSKISTLTDLSSFEMMMSYGAKIIPNHEREFPHIKELLIPNIVSSNNNDMNNPCKLKPLQSSLVHMGILIGAFELPITPNVVIDVWKDPLSKKSWATTSIDSVVFCVLERLFITTELVWGVKSVVQVDLFGRDPINEFIKLEKITQSID